MSTRGADLTGERESLSRVVVRSGNEFVSGNARQSAGGLAEVTALPSGDVGERVLLHPLSRFQNQPDIVLGE